MNSKEKSILNGAPNEKRHETNIECIIIDDPITQSRVVSDEEFQLLKGILQNPNDPYPKLVFSDWLEDHGRNMEARAWKEINANLDRIRFWHYYTQPMRGFCDFFDFLNGEKRNPKMTEEERQLLAGILKNPYDPCTKLVYSDWLEEHGREGEAYLWRVIAENKKRPRFPVLHTDTTESLIET